MTAAARQRLRALRRADGVRVLPLAVKVEAREGDDLKGIGNLEEALEIAGRLTAGITLDVEQIREATAVLIADWIAYLTREGVDPVPRATQGPCSQEKPPRR